VFNNTKTQEPVLDESIYLMIDPAAGGPHSDYAILSFTRRRGIVTVSLSLSLSLSLSPPSPLLLSVMSRDTQSQSQRRVVLGYCIHAESRGR
jgi:hypothetical protein